MLGIKKARKIIESNPLSPEAKVLAELVLALQSEGSIAVPQLFSLNNKDFELALEILDEWRLDRHYASKMRLLDISVQLQAAGEDMVIPPAPSDAALTAVQPDSAPASPAASPAPAEGSGSAPTA